MHQMAGVSGEPAQVAMSTRTHRESAMTSAHHLHINLTNHALHQPKSHRTIPK